MKPKRSREKDGRSVTEARPFHYLAIADESAMRLDASISSETISRVYAEYHEVTTKFLAVFSRQVSRFWLALPNDYCARRIVKLSLQPISDDLFIVGRISAIG